MTFSSTRAALLALALALAPAAALADDHDGHRPPHHGTGPGGMMGRHMMMRMPMMMGRHVEGRLAFVRAELEITAAQSAAWDKFAGAYRDSIKPHEMPRPPEGRGPGEHRPHMDLPARLELHQKMLGERLDRLNTLKGPLLALYGVLSDEQKRTADMLMGMLMH